MARYMEDDGEVCFRRLQADFTRVNNVEEKLDGLESMILALIRRMRVVPKELLEEGEF